MAELEAAVDLALQHDSRVVFERFVQGQEVECAVRGNDEVSGKMCIRDSSFRVQAGIIGGFLLLGGITNLCLLYTSGLQIGYDVHGGKALGNTLNGTPHQKLKPQCGAAAVDDIDVVIFCFFFGDLSALAGAGERCRQQHTDHGAVSYTHLDVYKRQFL